MAVKACISSTKSQKKSFNLALMIPARIFFLATLLWSTSLSATRENILFNGSFENTNLDKWEKEFSLEKEFVREFVGRRFTRSGKEICCKYSVQIVNSPVRKGNNAAKFTLYKDDPEVSNSRRAELRLNAVPSKSEYWYGFSNYLPPDFVKDPSFEVVSQWNARPDKHLGEDWRSPQLDLVTENGYWIIHRRWDPRQVTKPKNKPIGKEAINLGPYQTGVWTDWVFHVKWSYQSDGLVEVWKNGKLVLRRTGPNTYNDKVGPFQKFGIYKPDWKYNPDKSKTSKRVIYYDNIRMGNANARYKDVAP